MDKRGMDNRPSAVENEFFLFFMLIVLFVSPFEGTVKINAKNVQLGRRRKNFCHFV